MNNNEFLIHIKNIYNFLENKSLFTLGAKFNIYFHDNYLIHIKSENIPHLLGFQYIYLFISRKDNLQNFKIFLHEVISGKIKWESLKNKIQTNFNKYKKDLNKINTSKKLIEFIESKVTGLDYFFDAVSNYDNHSFSYVKNKKYELYFIFANINKYSYCLCLKNITRDNYLYKTLLPISMQFLKFKPEEMHETFIDKITK